eukprot:12123384-Prorocentrum_lima.AAC.1
MAAIAEVRDTALDTTNYAHVAQQSLQLEDMSVKVAPDRAQAFAALQSAKELARLHDSLVRNAVL